MRWRLGTCDFATLRRYRNRSRLIMATVEFYDGSFVSRMLVISLLR
jgi:hypothetical protein